MTLHRWHELECGDGHDWGSWCIIRGRKLSDGTLDYDVDGKPFMEHHHYLHGVGKDYTTYTPIGDKETGAKKRLEKIMARYPGLSYYIQTDPRGSALYILRPGDVPDGGCASAYYNRGIVVCK
jgi:hypothetical protein